MMKMMNIYLKSIHLQVDIREGEWISRRRTCVCVVVLNDQSIPTGMVIDVEHRLIVKNVYWPLLSDFVNILSQEKIALTIIENKKYFNLWLRFLTLFQGEIPSSLEKPTSIFF